jgi:methionyl-tRNA synthetase
LFDLVPDESASTFLRDWLTVIAHDVFFRVQRGNETSAVFVLEKNAHGADVQVGAD